MTTAVLLSGGVDSSVALRRLQDQGHDNLVAFYLKVWLEDELSYLGGCPWEEDLEYARSVCKTAGVPLEVVPLQAEYLERVVSYTIAELEAGHSPSPDILCNQHIKFGAFYEHLDGSFEKVATGHYARIREQNGRFLLCRGLDPVKDQTYFLSHLKQAQLARCLFPIGELQKSEVRELAKEYSLPNSERPDSQGICFLGKIRYNDFVQHHLGEQPGEILEVETGRRLGEHRGYWFHTIGQRKGLGLGEGPWYVVRKDLAENVIYVSHHEQLAAQARNRFQARDPSWTVESPSPGPCQVKIRHSEHTYDANLQFITPERLDVELASEDPGIAAGQFAVFYDGEVCLGGATIAG
ncbi:MAG: tRNA 2-thiouridine(34) synthase MnmA [Planctomycetota bacterium]